MQAHTLIELSKPSEQLASTELAGLHNSLAGLDKTQLADRLRALDIPEKQLRMRVNQLWQWIYVKGAQDFQSMTNIAKELRGKLEQNYNLKRPQIVSRQVSNDGTRKWLMRIAPPSPSEPPCEVEAVYIPEETRGTLCVSSQVGCTLNCSFCHTGTQRMVKNLSSAEIVGQLLVARDDIGEWPGAEMPDDKNLPTSERKITNVVLMGMGEPLYNFNSVRDAMEVVSHAEGISLSKRRITLSTSGVVPEIPRWGEESGTMLAISLHAVRDDLRDELVPLNRKYPIEQLLDACRNYPGLSNAKRITFEYVMLKGVNDSLSDARELVRLLKHIPAKINLIPFNPWPGSQYECSDWNQINKFADVVNRAGYASPVRTPRGRDIMAACGQLKSASERIKASQRKSVAIQQGA